MNTSLGYSKRTLTDSNVLLSGGGDKALSEFIGSLNWDSTNKKFQYKSASSNDFTDLITFGARAFDSTSYLPLSGGTMTGNIIMGSNSIVFNNSTTSDWNVAANTGIKLLNTVGESATGAPGMYHVGLSVSGYYGFQLATYGGGGRLLFRNTKKAVYPSWEEIAYLSDITWSTVSSKPETATRWPTWSEVTDKPDTFTPSSHEHDYIKAKSTYTFTSSNLPKTFDLGVSAGFVNSDSGFGSYGSVLTVRTYSSGGGTLQLYTPYSNTYGGSHIKARFGDYDNTDERGNRWTTLKSIAWLDDIPTKSSWNYDDMYVSSLTTSGNSLRWIKNGSNNDITIPYASKASLDSNGRSLVTYKEYSETFPPNDGTEQWYTILNYTNNYYSQSAILEISTRRGSAVILITFLNINTPYITCLSYYGSVAAAGGGFAGKIRIIANGNDAIIQGAFYASTSTSSSARYLGLKVYCEIPSYWSLPNTITADTTTYDSLLANVAFRNAGFTAGHISNYADNTYNIGSSTYKYKNVYATTFHGALDGNASTATNADNATYATSAGDADTLDSYHADSFKLKTSIWLPESKQTKQVFTTFLDASTTNLHNQSGDEVNLFRFFSSDAAASTYGYPVVDSHSLVFSADGAKDYIRALNLDVRTNDIYTIAKTNGTWGSWVKLLNANNYSSYALPLSGGTMTGLLTTTSGSHKGIKIGDTYITAIGGELILQNNTAIRFGGDSWDWNVWAALGYDHSNKIIRLGLAATPYTANALQSGGKIYTQGISDIYIGNGTYKVWHEGNDGTGSGLDADLLDGWHKDDIVATGYVTSGIENLSSYWGCVWDITITDSRFNNKDITFLVQSAYDGLWGLIHLSIRQLGANDSGDYLFALKLYETVGNIPVDIVRLYYNNSTGYCALWMNVRHLYGVFNVSIIKKCDRTTIDRATLGSLKTTYFQLVLTFPNSAYIEMLQMSIVNKAANAENSDALGGITLANLESSSGVTRSWLRGFATSANQYFGNGNVVTIDPMGTGCLSANDTILSLGDLAIRNTQLLFSYSTDGVWYRRITDGLSYGNWQRLAFLADIKWSLLADKPTYYGKRFDLGAVGSDVSGRAYKIFTATGTGSYLSFSFILHVTCRTENYQPEDYYVKFGGETCSSAGAWDTSTVGLDVYGNYIHHYDNWYYHINGSTITLYYYLRSPWKRHQACLVNFYDGSFGEPTFTDDYVSSPPTMTAIANFNILARNAAYFLSNVTASNFYTTSDRSKKYNISKLSEHIFKFTLKTTNKDAYGVIAQDVPEMFREGEEGNMTVNYNSILSYYVGLLENRVEQLEEKIKELENK